MGGIQFEERRQIIHKAGSGVGGRGGGTEMCSLEEGKTGGGGASALMRGTSSRAQAIFYF